MKAKTRLDFINNQQDDLAEVFLFNQIDPNKFKLVKKYAEYLKIIRLSDGKKFDLRR